MMNEKISWRFPVLGITESASNQIDYSFKTKCRVKVEKEIRFALPGVTDIDPNETFNVEVKIFTKELENALKRCFVLTPIQNTINSVEDEVVYMLRFLPFKPFKTHVEVLLSKPSGGRWRFKIHLESTEPEIDDVI